MMNFNRYSKQFRFKFKEAGYSDEEIAACLKYACQLNKSGLPVIFNAEHFSHLVGYQEYFVLQLSNSKNAYKEFKIPKRNGSMRTIDEPLPSLKEIQDWILQNILMPVSSAKVSPFAKAFIKGQNIRDNAKFHRNQDKLICLDIKDFFPSVNYKQVFHLFREFGYSKKVSTLLSRLCTYRWCLPQGAPTSPMLSNMIFYGIDRSISNYCLERKIRFTRYADDLTFSGNLMKSSEVIPFVRKILSKNGFKLNNNKTKVIGRGRCQEVTGITVNSKLQAARRYRMKIRQEVYYIKRFGIENHIKRISFSGSTKYYLHHLIGKLNFVLMVNKKDERAKEDLDFLKLLSSDYDNI